jgi:O-acetyl-ADP-ribose deacetylase (regulator of RNase III)
MKRSRNFHEESSPQTDVAHESQPAVQRDVRGPWYHGELPVGCAEIVETGESRWKYLIAAPTMRVPEPVSSTINAYLAFRAALVAAENFNKGQGRRAIDSLVCCGLATGVGGMSASRCASQMRIAYREMICPPCIGRFESIHGLHKALQMS